MKHVQPAIIYLSLRWRELKKNGGKHIQTDYNATVEKARTLKRKQSGTKYGGGRQIHIRTINKTWYKLKQVGMIAYGDLVYSTLQMRATTTRKTLLKDRRETRDIDFTLVVDGFLVKNITALKTFDHLRKAISKHYKFKVDLVAKQYVTSIST